MSIVRKCDRCGRCFDEHIRRVTIECKNPEFVDYDKHLCDDCMVEFYEFMRGVKPKNLLERLLRLP